MRASHGSWICCFLHVSLCLQFAMCPLLPGISILVSI
jgi:hypothetical protein